MKVPEGHSYRVLGIFAPEEVLLHAVCPWEADGRKKRSRDAANRREYVGDDGTAWSVKMSSHRYWVFKGNLFCVECGRMGTIMALEQFRSKPDQPPHFNLYAEEEGEWVLMTKDHIRPIADGGPSTIDNYQTMCSECNELKGSQT